LPDSNNSDIGDGLNTAGFRFNNPALGGIEDINEDQFTFRTDHHMRDVHRLLFRLSGSQRAYPDSVTKNDARYPGQPQGMQQGHNLGYSIWWDWAISPRLFNEVRLGQKGYSWDLIRPSRIEGPMLLANSWVDPLNPAFPSSRKSGYRQITDSFTTVKGGHTFKAGFEAAFTKELTWKDDGVWPDVRFLRSYNPVPSSVGPHGDSISNEDRQTFEMLYNDLLGRMSTVTQTFYSNLVTMQLPGTPRTAAFRYRDFSGYLQDDWRLNTHLTFNLGLRYEFFGSPVEDDGKQGVVDQAALIDIAARIDNFKAQPSRRWYAGDYNNFAPRVGIAWDPIGNGKMAVRVNWGVYYDRLIGATTTGVDGNTPGPALRGTFFPNSGGTDFRVSDGIPAITLPVAPDISPGINRAINTNLFLVSPKLRTGYLQHYSLTLQKEVFSNTIVEAGYVGTHGVKLFVDVNFDQPRIYEDFLPAFRELQAHNAYGTPVSGGNTLVRLYGTAYKAVTALGANIIDLGEVAEAADAVDLRYSVYSRYKQAGLSEYYLRNFPQFDKVVMGTNDGRSYYNSLQVSLRRQTGAVRFVANYTFSKSMDNISSDGNGFRSPIDNYNLRLNLARSDFDVPHAFNASLVYTLPFGKGRLFGPSVPTWLDMLAEGWDVGLLAIWQSGKVITYQSGFSTGPTVESSFADYNGDRKIGRVIRNAHDVYWLSPEEISRFSIPVAGEIGTGGRNAFRIRSGAYQGIIGLALSSRSDIHSHCIA
jgi:hypothetical protein